MNVENSEEVVGSYEAWLAGDILSLIEMKGVAEGVTQLLGLSLERESSDQVMEYVNEVLLEMGEDMSRLWVSMYNVSVVNTVLSESPSNRVHTE